MRLTLGAPRLAKGACHRLGEFRLREGLRQEAAFIFGIVASSRMARDEKQAHRGDLRAYAPREAVTIHEGHYRVGHQ